MRWEDTGLRWIPPSPNIPRSSTTRVYPATCLLEATNFSEGRGTESPFHTLGAPFVKSHLELADLITNAAIKGLGPAVPVTFTPTSSKFRGILCHGAVIDIAPADSTRPVRIGVEILSLLVNSYGDSLTMQRSTLARLLGDTRAYDMLMTHTDPQIIVSRWEDDLYRFSTLSRRYWQYPEK